MIATAPKRTSTRGRPVVTSHAAIEQAAFRLFAEHGFVETTLDDIARAVGVGRRTLFRYYQSKNDIPWGQFDVTLSRFRELLQQQPEDDPLAVVVHRAVLQFNEFPEDVSPPHRERMRLILTTPELQAHSVLRYTDWRDAIAEFVAARTGCAPTDLKPRMIAQVSLALALTAYEMWLQDENASLPQLLDQAMSTLVEYIGAAPAKWPDIDATAKGSDPG